MRTVHGLLLTAFIMLAFALWIAYEGLFNSSIKLVSAQYIAAAGFLGASAGWIGNSALTLRIKLREKSLDYLQAAAEKIFLYEKAAELNRIWVEVRMSEIVEDPTALQRFWEANFPSHEVFKSARYLANMYEQMAVAIKVRAVEERILRLYFASSLHWFMGLIRPLLPYYRNDPPMPGNPIGAKASPKTWSQCEWLDNKWQGIEE